MEVAMDTIGELREFLACFEPSLPLDVLVACGTAGSEFLTVSMMRIVDSVVVRSAGAPEGVWLVARPGSDGPPANVPAAIPMLRGECGCVLVVPVVLDRPVATWAIECEHSLSLPSR